MGYLRKDPADRYTRRFQSRIGEVAPGRDPGDLWNEEVKGLVRALYGGLILCVDDELYLQEFLPVGRMYRIAGELGALRRRQGVPMETVMLEHVLLRDVFWEFHRRESEKHDFQVEKRLCQSLNSLLQSSLHAYETRDIIMDVLDPIRDQVTGLFNSHYFFLRLEEEVSRAERYRRDLSVGGLVIQDLRGDFREEALRGCARVLRSDSRACDLISRLEDGEFVILFPETTKDGARVACQRLASRLAEYLEEKIEGLGRARMVLGISSYPADGGEPAALVEVALRGRDAGGSEGEADG